ncbi:MAG TPA: lysophospholipid acyltransferase family protein [Burkholderiales bacterium]
MSVPLTSRWTRVSRILRLVLHLLRGMAIAGVLFPFISEARRRGHIRRWSRQVLAILAIRLHVQHADGAESHSRLNAMLVANHVSWIDIFAIDAIMPARFVAKSEVARWPLVGWLSTRVGTLYVSRSRRHDTARINRDVSAALQRGELVAVFPEGRTTDGSRILKFHSSLLQPAVSVQAAILPVALSYWRADGTRCTELAYDRHWSLWDTVRRMVRLKRIECRLTVLPLMRPQHHRRILADDAHAAIATALGICREGVRQIPRDRDDSGLPEQRPVTLRGGS